MPSLEEEGYKTITYRRMGKVKRFIFHWRQGLRDQFPICCVLRFSIECALMDGKTYPLSYASARQRGSIDQGHGVFVPCNVFHHASREKPPV